MGNAGEKKEQEKRFAVIGDPVAHSLSPLLHQTVYAKLGVHATFEKQRVAPEALAAFLTETELDGFNVTIPHKERICGLLAETRGDKVNSGEAGREGSLGDKVNSGEAGREGPLGDAALAGAVNTVVREGTVNSGKAGREASLGGGCLVGYNTDMAGLLKALRGAGADYAGAAVCVFGTGGAARGAARKAASEGAKEIRILGRNKEKAEAILPGAFRGMPTAETLRGADIFLNATPLGMTGMASDFEDLSFLEGLPEHALVYDLVYTPAETRLLAAARARGLRAENGLSMLVWQGLLADVLFGIAPEQTLLTQEYYDTVYAVLGKELVKTA